MRDYEAFIFGAALLKPDMSHMETWPNVFIKDETYCSFNWDYSNLEEKILELLDSSKKRIDLANSGQSIYKNSISNKGMVEFCNWFTNQIEL